MPGVVIDLATTTLAPCLPVGNSMFGYANVDGDNCLWQQEKTGSTDQFRVESPLGSVHAVSDDSAKRRNLVHFVGQR